MKRALDRLVILGVALVMSLVAPGCTPTSPSTSPASSAQGQTPVSPSAPPATPAGPARPVGVQLFQWNWKAIAAECPQLAKDGYAFVQTSPPQESILGEPWWIVYQPVSYQLESTLGTRAEFAAMVKTCKGAGVEVYADVVINHMTGQDTPGVGSGGSKFSHYDYPGIYGPKDFHHCGLTDGDEVVDYGNQAQVQTCELLNLADLNTSLPKVRTTIAAYLNDLMSLGVVGFRVDAAKHISPADLAAIMALVTPKPKLILEVIRGGDNEPVQPENYVTIGPSQEFGFARDVSSAFINFSFDQFNTFATASWLPPASAITFIDNHDTERNGETASIANPKPYRMAEAFLLGYGYGTPVVYSGYEFGGVTDAGPPRAAKGRVQQASCGTPPWTCNHRDKTVVGMVAFHRAVGGAEATSMAEGNLVGIERKGQGFVWMNAGDSAASSPWTTGLPAGSFCNLAVPGCTEKVEVGADGKITSEIAPDAVVAIAVAAQNG